MGWGSVRAYVQQLNQDCISDSSCEPAAATKIQARVRGNACRGRDSRVERDCLAELEAMLESLRQENEQEAGRLEAQRPAVATKIPAQTWAEVPATKIPEHIREVRSELERIEAEREVATLESVRNVVEQEALRLKDEEFRVESAKMSPVVVAELTTPPNVPPEKLKTPRQLRHTAASVVRVAIPEQAPLSGTPRGAMADRPRGSGRWHTAVVAAEALEASHRAALEALEAAALSARSIVSIDSMPSKTKPPPSTTPRGTKASDWYVNSTRRTFEGRHRGGVRGGA